MITYNKKQHLFKIDTRNTSYIMAVADNGYLGHVYYGEKLNSSDVRYLMSEDEWPFDPVKTPGEKGPFIERFAMEYPCSDNGDFRGGCIGVRNGAGQKGLELIFDSYRVYAGDTGLKSLPHTWGSNAETLEITLKDECAGVKVLLNYCVYGDADAICRSAIIYNIGDEAFYITNALSACVDVRDEEYELLTLNGSWGRERHICTRPIGYGTTGIESQRGIPGHQQNPFIAMVSKGCTQESGYVYAMNLIYSSNFEAGVTRDQFDNDRMFIGINHEGFEWKLEPGELLEIPEAVMVFSASGLGHMTRTFHDLYRNHLIRSGWKYMPRPVLINNWEATHFDFDSDKLIEIAERAADKGIEMFVMDDGWFGHRNSDNSSLGDWVVNKNKIKGGLKHLVNRINSMGMKFGIWFEPEMVSPDSDLYRMHPDWVMEYHGREGTQVRNQYVLDLTRPETVDYVYESIASVLRSANVEYVKWDMNRSFTDVGSNYLPADRQGEICHRQILAVYAMQERLLEEFPGLLLESCSGGGARFDPGMLYFSPQIWCSDDTDAIERLAIQEGTAMVYPVSTIGSHVSACPNYETGRVTPFKTRGEVALCGTFGYELDVTKLSDEETDMIPIQVELYKKYSRLIQTGDYYRIASYSGNGRYDCYEIVSKDRKSALVTFVQVLAEPNMRKHLIRLCGLEPDAVYNVNGVKYTGDVLMKAGLPVVRPVGDYASILIEINVCGDK